MTSNTLEITALWQAFKESSRQRLGHLLETGYLSDVVFLVGSGNNVKVISAHKLILSSGSHVFADMFESGTTEPIEVPDITPDIFLQLLWYIYTDNLALKPKADEVKQLIDAADKYCIPVLFNYSNAYLRSLLQNIKTEHIHTPKVFGVRKRKDLNVTIISYSPVDVLKGLEFLNAKKELVELILEVDETSLTSEYEFFSALLSWGNVECGRRNLEVNLTNMKDIIKPLFPNIRFLALSLTGFMGAVNVFPGLFDNEEANGIYCNIISCEQNLNNLPSWCNKSGNRKLISTDIWESTIANTYRILYFERFNYKIALIRFQNVRRAVIITGIRLEWIGEKVGDYEEILGDNASKFQRISEIINLTTNFREMIVFDSIRESGNDIIFKFRKVITLNLGDEMEFKLLFCSNECDIVDYFFEATAETPEFDIASCSNISSSGFILKEIIYSSVKVSEV